MPHRQALRARIGIEIVTNFVRSDVFRNFLVGFVLGVAGIMLWAPEAHARVATAIERIIA